MRQNILLGKCEILEYLKVSDAKLMKLIEAGLPAKKIADGWCAHVQNIDEFFKQVTKGK